MSNEPDLADDLLNDADEIGAFLGWSRRQVYHAAEKNRIPIIRLSGSRTLRARKSELRRALSAAA